MEGVKFFFSAVALLGCTFAGCVTEPHRAIKDSKVSSVREVRFVGTPDNPELAQKAQALGNMYFPQIYSTLSEGAQDPPQFGIIFQKDLARRYKSSVRRSTQNMPKMMNYYPSGVAVRGNVYLDAETFFKEPRRLDGVLLHEMAHLAQRYPWYRRITMPFYWQEGIAEAMISKVNNPQAIETRPCKCTALSPHYISGYSCTAAFLLYMENTYDPELISRLNRAIRDGSYKDDFFCEATGRTLDQLWSEFLQTNSVRPMAAKINQIYDALGYRNGKPPRNVKARFRAYLAKEPKGEELIRTLEWADFDDRKMTDIQALITTSVYFAGAGGSIIEAGHLQDQGRLPGLARGDKGTTFWEPSSMQDLDLREHQSPHEVRALKEGDRSTYHYQFVRACDDCAWTLDKAWRTDEKGALVEQYAIDRN
jgi:hypothetical protein